MAITSKYKITALIAAIVIVVIGVMWIGGKRQGEEDVIKIGAILPLTGTASDIGEWCQKGIEVAVSEINQPGAVYQQRLQVLFEDSRNDPKTGLSALNKLTSLDKVPIVIVAMSSVASAILPAADQNNTIAFATVVSLPRFTQRSEWAFRYHISGDSEAKAMSTFARKELGLKKLAVLYIDDEFGRSTYAELENAFRVGGSDIIFAEGFSKDVQDYRSLIAKVRQQSPEGVYVVGYDKAYATILKQLGESGISAKILTNSGLEIPAWRNLVGKAAEGAYYTTTLYTVKKASQTQRNFVELYQQQYQTSPPYIAAECYDVVHLIARAAKDATASSSSELKDALSRIKDIDLAMGKVTIDNRDALLPLVIMQIRDGQPALVREAE